MARTTIIYIQQMAMHQSKTFRYNIITSAPHIGDALVSNLRFNYSGRCTAQIRSTASETNDRSVRLSSASASAVTGRLRAGGRLLLN
jgi:hypothetical protein